MNDYKQKQAEITDLNWDGNIEDTPDLEVITKVKEILKQSVQPQVAMHGGHIEFIEYKNGILKLMLQGACSGCAGSTITLKMGVENLIKHYVPEVKEIIAIDDPNSTVDPFYNQSTDFGVWGQDDPNT